MLVKTFGSAVYGVDAITITVEVNAGGTVAAGKNFYHLVGLPDSAVKEGFQRFEAALTNIGKKVPRLKLVVNMAPADIRKEGSAYDLTIAMGILGASEHVNSEELSEYVIMGELSLDGGLNPIKGVLPIALRARDDGFKAFVQLVVDTAFEAGATDHAALMAGGLEDQRQSLVQKIGENITVRRVHAVEGANIGGYVHGNGKIAVLTSLTAGSSELAKDVAMHVAAVNPQVARAEDMSAELLEKERAIYVAQAAESGKPADIVEKMVEGRVKKFLAESSLVEQPFVKDPDLKVGKLMKDAGADIVTFCRFEVGEGIEKEDVDFAAEVAAQVQQSN